MRVAVMGTGRVGVVTCVALSKLGHEVVGTDVDRDKIDLLRRGVAPFFEPGLATALLEESGSGRLTFTTSVAEALPGAEVVFICVGTPARADGEANLIAVEQAVRDIARHAGDGSVVVEKSTVPAGTAERVRRTLQREGGGRRVDVASNPEFLREGMALRDALEPDRIVLGVESDHGREVLERLYATMLADGVRCIVTDIPTAELAKSASNAFLATKISFANALARLCERGGADVTAVAEMMGADPRIGRAFLDAGIGYGGYCLPKDVAALERLAAKLGYAFPLLDEIVRINDEAVEAVLARVEEAVWNVEGKRVALFGLAFKPDTDDIRSSPALKIAVRLLADGADVVGYDPQAAELAMAEVPGLRTEPTALAAATGAHCVVVATEWAEFRDLDPRALRDAMSHPVLVDGRNLYDPAAMREAGFWYYPTGRPPVVQTAPAAGEAVAPAARGGTGI